MPGHPRRCNRSLFLVGGLLPSVQILLYVLISRDLFRRVCGSAIQHLMIERSSIGCAHVELPSVSFPLFVAEQSYPFSLAVRNRILVAEVRVVG